MVQEDVSVGSVGDGLLRGKASEEMTALVQTEADEVLLQGKGDRGWGWR